MKIKRKGKYITSITDTISEMVGSEMPISSMLNQIINVPLHGLISVLESFHESLQVVCIETLHP